MQPNAQGPAAPNRAGGDASVAPSPTTAVAQPLFAPLGRGLAPAGLGTPAAWNMHPALWGMSPLAQQQALLGFPYWSIAPNLAPYAAVVAAAQQRLLGAPLGLPNSGFFSSQQPAMHQAQGASLMVAAAAAPSAAGNAPSATPAQEMNRPAPLASALPAAPAPADASGSRPLTIADGRFLASRVGAPAAPTMSREAAAVVVPGRTQRRFQCELCGRRFTRRVRLQTHLNSHYGTRPFQCQVPGCRARFADPSNRRRHERAHERHLTASQDGQRSSGARPRDLTPAPASLPLNDAPAAEREDAEAKDEDEEDEDEEAEDSDVEEEAGEAQGEEEEGEEEEKEEEEAAEDEKASVEEAQAPDAEPKSEGATAAKSRPTLRRENTVDESAATPSPRAGAARSVAARQ